jgi:hypothetical protein
MVSLSPSLFHGSNRSATTEVSEDFEVTPGAAPRREKKFELVSTHTTERNQFICKQKQQKLESTHAARQLVWEQAEQVTHHAVFSHHARIPVPAPPPTHALSAPFLIFSLSHAHARKFFRLRKRSHAAPRVQRWVSRAHNPQRHFWREDRPQRRV